MSQSVDRALTVLVECSSEPRKLSELAGVLDVHRSTVLRILQTLEERHFVRRTDDGLWTIGFGLTDIALDALDALEVRTAAHASIRQLSRELGHTIHLAELAGTDVVYIDKVEGVGAVRMKSRVGAPVQIHTAGVAKVILAFAPRELRDKILSSISYPKFTTTTLTSPAAMLAELDKVARQGWAVDDGEFEDYINCIAVPIHGHDGSVVAGLSVTALRAIEPLDRLQLHIPLVQTVAGEISAQLGWNAGSKARS